MPFTGETATDWVTMTVKVPKDMHDKIEAYIAKQQEESISAALRTLIAIGLESTLATDGVVLSALRANVQAKALARIDLVMSNAVEIIKSGRMFEDDDTE